MAQVAAPTARLPACDDMVEIRLVVSKGMIRRSEPDRDPATLPQAVLRLPRLGTRVVADDGQYWLTELCNRTTFMTWTVSTRGLGYWAGRFGIPYFDADPVQQVGFGLTYPAPPPPVDDSADRAGFAARGAWIVDQSPRTDRGSAKFCLLPPAPPDQCYAFWGVGMTYTSGGLRVHSRAFFMDSLWQRRPLGRLITVADLDRHFAFLRALADAAVVRGPDPHQQ